MAATITNVAVAFNLVTITTSGSHGFFPGQWVAIAGLTNSSLDGTYPIATTPLSTTFTYYLNASPPTVLTSVGDSGTATLALGTAPGVGWVSAGSTAAAVSSASIPCPDGVTVVSTSAFSFGFNGGITHDGGALTDGFYVPANTITKISPRLWGLGVAPNLNSLYVVAGGTLNVWFTY